MSVFRKRSYWASEASPTLGCAIEILRDICRYVMSVCLQKIRMSNVWEELRDPNTRMLKVGFGQLKPTCDTRNIHFYYTLEQF